MYVYTRRKFCQQFIRAVASGAVPTTREKRSSFSSGDSIHVYLYIFNDEDERSNALNPSSIYAYIYIYIERDLGRLAVYTLHIYYIIYHIPTYSYG